MGGCSKTGSTKSDGNRGRGCSMVLREIFVMSDGEAKQRKWVVRMRDRDTAYGWVASEQREARIREEDDDGCSGKTNSSGDGGFRVWVNLMERNRLAQICDDDIHGFSRTMPGLLCRDDLDQIGLNFRR